MAGVGGAAGTSSSVSVSSAPFTVRPVAAPATPIVSATSIRVSSVGVRVNVAVPLVASAAIVTVKSVTAS